MISYFKKISMILIILLLSIGLIGCMNEQDLTNRAIITGIGIDKAEDGEIEFTLQIVNPSGLGLEEGSGGPNIDPVWINSTKGKTIYEAVREQLRTANRRPFYSHVQVMVIGEELAKEGIKDILDFFARDYEVRLNSSVVVARGTTAKNVISAKSTMTAIPAMHLKDILENNDHVSIVRNINTFELLKDINENILNTTIGVIRFKDGGKEEIKNMELEGTAVFKEDKLVGWLEKYETIGLLYIKDEMSNRVIGIKNPLEEDQIVIIEQIRSKGKINAKIEDENLKIEVNIKAEGIIGEQHGHNDLLAKEMIEELETRTENAIKENITKVVDIAQDEFESDIFGFGQEVHKKYLEYWREIENDWDEIFPNIPVEINVEFKIRRSGLTGPPSKTR